MNPLNFAVFGIVEMPNGTIVLVQEKGNFPKKMWKLPGGRPRLENGEHEQNPEFVLHQEIGDETGLVVKVDEQIFLTQVFKRNPVSYTLDSHDFIVYACRHYSGEPKPNAEIECCEAFSKDEILKLISASDVLPLHAKALTEYFKKVEDEVAQHAPYED